MKNIIIFGGAFDPIHFGHLNMAINASKTLDADVFFVPARISVWKNKTAPIEDKIKMIKLAIKAVGMEKRFKVSRIEADSTNDTNYTIDTVKTFKEMYPDDNLFLLIGTDQVNSFHLWKNAVELASLTKIIYFERSGLELDKENINKFSMMKIDGCTSPTNSTDIRELRDLNTPLEVINYIIDNNLYFVEKLKKYLTEERYNHVVSVARLAYEIAKANKVVEAKDYMLAGLLHDIGKNLPFDDQLKIMNDFYPQYLSFNRKIYHQFTGEHLAKADFGITNPDILSSIKYHTTGKADMKQMEKVVYCADKIEPTRGFDSSDLINAIEVNIDKGFITILKANKDFFEDNNVDFNNELTKACMEFYLK